MILMLRVCLVLASHPSCPLNLGEAFLTFFLELDFVLVLFPRILIFLHLRILLNPQIVLLLQDLLAPLPYPFRPLVPSLLPYLPSWPPCLPFLLPYLLPYLPSWPPCLPFLPSCLLYLPCLLWMKVLLKLHSCRRDLFLVLEVTWALEGDQAVSVEVVFIP